MTPATDDADYAIRPEPVALPQPRTGLAVWPLACAACAGLFWSAGWSLGHLLFPDSATFPVEFTVAEAAALGGGYGFLVGAAIAVLPRRRAATVLTWGAWSGFSAAVGGALSVVAISLGHGVLPPEVASALGFSVAGILLGIGGCVWHVRETGAGGITPRPRAAPPWTVLGATGWALAGAALAAGSWVLGLALGRLTMGVDFADNSWYAAETAWAVTAGGGFGLLVGASAGACLGTRGRGFSNRLEASLFCGAVAAIATALGGLSVSAVVNWLVALPPVLSSALGFSAAGLLLGLGGYAWSRANVAATEAEDILDEEAIQTPGAGKAAIGTRRVAAGFARPGLRFLPALLVSVAALVAAALVDSRGAAVALLAVGLLGLSVVPVLWNQERRLRELERRFHGESRESVVSSS